MKLFVANVTWYDPEETQQGALSEHLVIAAETIADASRDLADYYGEENIETMKITVINPEAPRALINQKTYQDLLECDI